MTKCFKAGVLLQLFIAYLEKYGYHITPRSLHTHAVVCNRVLLQCLHIRRKHRNSWQTGYIHVSLFTMELRKETAVPLTHSNLFGYVCMHGTFLCARGMNYLAILETHIQS